MLMYINSGNFNKRNKDISIIALQYSLRVTSIVQRSAITVGFELREIHAVVDNESLA